MNSYNPLISAHRLEEAGLSRRQAEAIATEIGDGTNNLVTKDQLEAALDKQTIRMSIIMAAMFTLACTILGTLIATLPN